DARHRLALTGTPVENNLEELWSLCSVLQPGLLGDRKRFAERFRVPIERQGDGDRLRVLSARVAPFMLRREKAEVLDDLPPKEVVVDEVELSGDQSDLYESVRATMDKKVRDAVAARGFARSQIVVLDALLKLRQCCCHPPLVKVGPAAKVKRSAKLERCLELIDQLVSAGRRVLLFSQFV